MRCFLIRLILLISLQVFARAEHSYAYLPQSLPLKPSLFKHPLYTHSFVDPVRSFLERYENDTRLYSDDDSKICTGKVMKLAESLVHSNNMTAEAASFFDSLGKPPSGILRGNLLLLGSYDSCLNLNQVTHGYFKPCKISAKITIEGTSAAVVWTTCFPRECRDGNFTKLKRVIVDGLNVDKRLFSIDEKSIITRCDISAPYSAGSYIALVVIVTILLLVTIGSLWEPVSILIASFGADSEMNKALVNCEENHGIQEDPSRLSEQTSKPSEHTSALGQFFTCFSVQRTFAGLLSTATKSGQILCLNGIRVLSINWVVLGHVYFIGINVGGDQLTTVDLYKRKSFPLVWNGFPSVDSFFCLSGFLVSYLLLKELARRDGSFNVIAYYVHRYLRLTAPYLVVILIQGFLVNLFIDGPFTEMIEIGSRMCKKWWWTNLLYINNLVPWSKVEMCVGQSWYLSNDMQFFILAPLFIVLLYRNTALGLLVTCLTWVASVISAGALTYVDDFGPTPVFDGKVANMTQFRLMYDKPWIRIPPYLIGILGGWIFYKYRNTMVIVVQRLSLMKRLIFGSCIWIITCAIQYGVVFGLHHDMMKKLDLTLPTKAESVLYETLSRSCWGLALVIQIIACETKLGGIINTVLSWKVWLVLSRLTFAVYLVHYILIQVLVSQLRHPFYFAPDYEVAIIYLGCLSMSYAVAVVLYTFVEQPLGLLERLTYRK